MSLQNKANAFFGSQNTNDTTDEVEDIFEQYGSGASPSTAATPTDDAVPETSAAPSSDALPTEPETRAWEREFAQQDGEHPVSAMPSITPDPFSHITPAVEDSVQTPRPDAAPVSQRDSMLEKDLASDAALQPASTPPPATSDSTLEPSAAPTSAPTAVSTPTPDQTVTPETALPKTDAIPTPTIDPIATHAPARSMPDSAAATQADVPVAESETTAAPVSQRTEADPIPPQTPIVDDRERSPRYTEPVAAPVHRNINAVIENAPDADVKKSVTPRSTQTLPQTVDPSKKTILIVDDDVDTLEMYATIFENADYNVLRAADGLEALSIVATYTPHVIFTGVVMPRMDGFTMIDALRQNARTADIPIVINSHLGRAADKKRSEELGVRDFIVRGFTTPREVLERIGALLLRSEYSFHFDANDREARKLAKDLGAENFFMCPRGQKMVIKLSVVDPRELKFSARFSCVDVPKSD